MTFSSPVGDLKNLSRKVHSNRSLKNSTLQNRSAGKGLSRFQGQEKDFSASFFGIWFFVFQLFLSGPSGFSPKSRNFRHEWTFSNPFIHSYPLILKLHTSSSVPRTLFKKSNKKTTSIKILNSRVQKKKILGFLCKSEIKASSSC